MAKRHAPASAASSDPSPVGSPRADALLVGTGWFVLVMVTAIALRRAGFFLDRDVQAAGTWIAGAAFFAWLMLGTPSSRLKPPALLLRQRRRTAALIGSGTALCLLGGFVAACQLRSWSEWVVLAAIIMATVGLGFAVNTHLLFRRR
jgi:hypothetical protein